MEVHHHPHVEKKNFKEYFLEFLMIFLAVTLGFFAENIREHLSDNAKEKEYIESLVEDLKIDQQILSHNISQLQSGIVMMDSMITILDNTSLISNNTGVANQKLISFFGVLGLLVVFEFINLVIHPWLAAVTHESPILMLLALVFIDSLLIPLHHRLEHWIKERMIEKNKAIRLAAAKKTIEKLEGNKP
jgi:hypothetical protein